MKQTTKAIICIVLILATIGFYLHHEKDNKKIAPAAAVTNVLLSPVTVTDIPLQIQATGNLTPNQQANISPQISGYIAKINFTEGAFVKKNAVLLSFDTREQAAKVAEARSIANLSADNYRRNAKLGTMAISKQDLENLRSLAEQNKAALLAAQTVLDQMTLRAPFDGYVGAKNVSVGDFISAGQKVVSVSDISELKISYQVPARYADQLKLNQPVIITDENSSSFFKGNVSYIAPTVDQDTQSIEVHAIFNNQNHNLKAGEFVTLVQTLGVKKNALLIPESSLLGNIDGYYVLQVNAANQVVATPVTPGEHFEGNVVIKSGLNSSDKIISAGQLQVKAGDTVAVVAGAVAPAKAGVHLP